MQGLQNEHGLRVSVDFFSRACYLRTWTEVQSIMGRHWTNKEWASKTAHSRKKHVPLYLLASVASAHATAANGPLLDLVSNFCPGRARIPCQFQLTCSRTSYHPNHRFTLLQISLLIHCHFYSSKKHDTWKRTIFQFL